MSAYTERKERYDAAVKIGYHEILKIAKESPYQSMGNGKQYIDFIVGNPDDKVYKVRVLIDFRGEYYSSFFIDSPLPIDVKIPIRNTIHFTAREAYERVISKAIEFNQSN